MPWVEETLRHDSFLDDLFDKVFRRFKDKSGNYWWQDFNDKTPKVDLYKITFEKGLFVRDTNGYKVPENPQEGNICVTRHIIMRRWDNELLAFAQSTGAVKIATEDLPKDKTELMKWFVEFYKSFVDYTTVYAYTMDTYEGYTHFITGDGKVDHVTVMTDDSGFGVFRASLDIEYYSEDEYYPDIKQSPIIVMKLKGDTGESVASIGKLNYRTNTNWWADSLIQLRGVFDETSCFFTLKVDSAPAWEDNNVTLVPFFFGNLVVKGVTEPNKTPIAMLGGTQVGKFFDFDNIEIKTETLQPITRNYVNHPSNGIDSVMVKKTKYGARYQEHFLRWNVPPNLMPPTREELRLVKDAMGTEKEEEFARKYPRAWNYLRFGYYNYNFHPSRYNDKIHASRATVMHPEDGVIGYIPNIVLLPLINIMDGDILKFSHWCADCAEAPYNSSTPEASSKMEWSPSPTDAGGSTEGTGSQPTPVRFSHYNNNSVDPNTIDDEYYVTIVEGNSPFTKRPSTHFRLAAIGMLMNSYCFVRKDTPNQPPISKPADSPVIGDKPTPPCALTINPTTVNKSTGETATFTLNHANQSGVLKVETKFDTTALEDLGNGSFKVLKDGTFPVDFIVIYNDGQECKVTGTIVGEFSCEFDVTASVTTTEVGQTITFTYNHGKNASLLKGVSMELPPEVTKVGDNKVTSNIAGAFQIRFIADYGDGNLCEKTLIVEFTQQTPPPSSGGDNVILCGQTVNSLSGFGEFIHPVTEEGIYYIEYDFLGAEDRMYVYVGGQLIHDTGERKYKEGSPFGFHYKPSDGELKVKMNNAGSGTKWTYTLYCPSSVPQEVRDKATIIN